MLAVAGVWLLTEGRFSGQPLGFLFAFATCAWCMLSGILGHRIAQEGGAAGMDRLGAARLIALAPITPLAWAGRCRP